jgi:hypothetical protein
VVPSHEIAWGVSAARLPLPSPPAAVAAAAAVLALVGFCAALPPRLLPA